MIRRGQILECKEKPVAIDGVTPGRTYVAANTRWLHGKQYVVVLGDDNHGHLVMAKLFEEKCGRLP